MNSRAESIGVFGKLPAHGDFIQRNISSSFLNVWDEWMQYFISGTKEQIGENWLNIYLTSPIWRFVFSPGVIDDSCWTGIMLPSVDRVGRYYPFSVIKKLPANSNPFYIMQVQTTWYTQIESLSLAALDDEIIIDDLMCELEQLNNDGQSETYRQNISDDIYSFQFDMEFEEQSVSSAFPFLLETLMSETHKSYSLWQTTGSEFISPCFFSSQGLPKVQQMPAMLNGDWENYNWQQPYILNDFISKQGLA